MLYEALNSPVAIGSLTLKNRLVFAPTTMGLKEAEYGTAGGRPCLADVFFAAATDFKNNTGRLLI